MSISTDAPTSGTPSIAFVDCEISAGAGPSAGASVHAHAGKYALDVGFKSGHLGPDRPALIAPSRFGEVRRG
jgi:hypothetical protein